MRPGRARGVARSAGRKLCTQCFVLAFGIQKFPCLSFYCVYSWTWNKIKNTQLMEEQTMESAVIKCIALSSSSTQVGVEIWLRTRTAAHTGRYVSQSRIASPVGDRGSHYWEISRAPLLVFVSSAHVLAPSGMALHPPRPPLTMPVGDGHGAGVGDRRLRYRVMLMSPSAMEKVNMVIVDRRTDRQTVHLSTKQASRLPQTNPALSAERRQAGTIRSHPK